LEAVFGYDKYKDITSEYAIKGTYCDLAIVDNKKIRFLIEAKAISVALNDKHLKQALDYGANAGVNWVILTNAEKWVVYKIKFGQQGSVFSHSEKHQKNI
jgi:predicted type IV restriction endonuclease